MHFKSNFPQFVMVQDVASIKAKCRLGHGLKNTLVIQFLELIPLRQDGKCMRPLTCRVDIRCGRNSGFQSRMCFLAHVTRVVHFQPHILPPHLRIVHMDFGLLQDKIANNEQGRSFANVAGVLLKRKSKNGNLLASNGVEHGVNHLLREALLLVVVHKNDLVPILSTFLQSVRLAKIDQVENILLKARSTKSNGRVEETLSDTVVHSNGTGDFRNIGSGGFAQGGDGVDGRHTLGEEGIGNQLRQLRRPKVCGENLLARNPVGVNGRQRFGGRQSLGTLHSSN
mmetsp:Transcript_1111/g.2346  ORF Transcript_1111/g.2346 Transcript_1111/m.2346 type:complete len:283 (+) Transcript_1111:206-1054(+)